MTVSGEPRRILLVNQYAGSPDHGMEFRPYELAREWQMAGHEVRVVAGSPSHLRAKEPKLTGFVTSERVGGIRYEWLRLPAYTGNGARRAANMIVFAILLRARARKLARTFDPHVVIASSTQPLDIYGARAIATRSGARLVFEVHDIWPLTPIELGGLSPRHPFIMLLSRAERDACVHADLVVSILPAADRHLVTRGMSPSRYVHVPNGVSIADSDSMAEPMPEAHASLVARLRRDHFLVGYTGAVGLANAMDDLISAAALLRAEPISFLLWGDGPDRQRLEQRVTAERLSNVHILGPIPKAAVRSALESCDALYLGWKDRGIYRFGVSPNKLFDYMAAGRPIVHATSAPADPVAEYRCGVSVPAESPSEIARAISQLSTMPKAELNALGARGRARAIADHDYKALARRFLDAVDAHGA